jgi:hypothetical protein
MLISKSIKRHRILFMKLLFDLNYFLAFSWSLFLRQLYA